MILKNWHNKIFCIGLSASLALVPTFCITSCSTPHNDKSISLIANHDKIYPTTYSYPDFYHDIVLTVQLKNINDFNAANLQWKFEYDGVPYSHWSDITALQSKISFTMNTYTLSTVTYDLVYLNNQSIDGNIQKLLNFQCSYDNVNSNTADVWVQTANSIELSDILNNNDLTSLPIYVADDETQLKQDLYLIIGQLNPDFKSSLTYEQINIVLGNNATATITSNVSTYTGSVVVQYAISSKIGLNELIYNVAAISFTEKPTQIDDVLYEINLVNTTHGPIIWGSLSFVMATDDATKTGNITITVPAASIDYYDDTGAVGIIINFNWGAS